MQILNFTLIRRWVILRCELYQTWMKKQGETIVAALKLTNFVLLDM